MPPASDRVSNKSPLFSWGYDRNMIKQIYQTEWLSAYVIPTVDKQSYNTSVDLYNTPSILAKVMSSLFLIIYRLILLFIVFLETLLSIIITVAYKYQTTEELYWSYKAQAICPAIDISI
jgi:hypothetical protein